MHEELKMDHVERKLLLFNIIIIINNIVVVAVAVYKRKRCFSSELLSLI